MVLLLLLLLMLMLLLLLLVMVLMVRMKHLRVVVTIAVHLSVLWVNWRYRANGRGVRDRLEGWGFGHHPLGNHLS